MATTATRQMDSDSIATELKAYEDEFPEGVFRSISCALTGVNNTTLGRVIDVIDESEDGEDSETMEEARRWQVLLRSLTDLEAESLSMRQYDGNPEDINETGTKGPYGLLTHNSKLRARGVGRVYHLPDGRKAVVWNREPVHGTVSVKVGPWKGTLHVALCDNVDEWFEAEMAGANWRRPADLA